MDKPRTEAGLTLRNEVLKAVSRNKTVSAALIASAIPAIEAEAAQLEKERIMKESAKRR